VAGVAVGVPRRAEAVMGEERFVRFAPCPMPSMLGHILRTAIDVSGVCVAHAVVRHRGELVAVHRGDAASRAVVEHSADEGRLSVRVEGDDEPRQLLELARRLVPHMRAVLTQPELAATAGRDVAAARGDALAAELEHRLRTRVTVARGWVELLRAERVDPRREAQALEVTSRNLGEIEALLRGRGPTTDGRGAPFPEDRIDLIAAVRRAVREFAWVLDSRLEGPLVRGTAWALSVPAAEIDDVLLHLLDNAAEHAGDEARIEVLLTYRPDEVRLSVEDAGSGFPADLAARVGVGMRVVDRLASSLGAVVERGRSTRLGGAAVHLRWRR
jgi:signal transduction histidine kinase